MPHEPSDIPEQERQLEAAKSGHFGHAEQRAVAPDGGQQGNNPEAASQAAQAGDIADNYRAERRQLDARPPLPPEP